MWAAKALRREDILDRACPERSEWDNRINRIESAIGGEE